MAKSKLVHKIFHGKILLLGEHLINRGARGIALPLSKYDGLLKLGDVTEPTINSSNSSINALADFIIHDSKLCDLFDTNSLLEHLEDGLYFDSNIPQGYGVGSSGALVAAVFSQYRRNKKQNDLNEVKDILAKLEAFFHGTSSGLDPMVSYTDKMVILENGSISVSNIPLSTDSLQVFVIDTKLARSTSQFVNLFLEKYEESKFHRIVNESLVPATNIAIESFLHRRAVQLYKSVQVISQLQLDHMQDFIPENFRKIWLSGLSSGQYALKISGAGGGGFILGFAPAKYDLSILLEGVSFRAIMKC